MGGETMEKNNAKVIAIVALVVAVIALSAGFAAFSATLNIENASATVTKGTDLFAQNVNYVESTTSCYATGTSDAVTGADAGSATGKTWSNIHVPLASESGNGNVQSVTCEATIANASAYTAYLVSITSGGNLQCTSTGADAASSATVTAICDGTTVTVHVGNASPTAATDKLAITTNTNPLSVTTGLSNTITARANDTNGTTKVYVTAAYTGSTIADGDVVVSIPTITLGYRTAR